MPDLTTIGAVKDWLGNFAASNTSADKLLGTLITATSADFLRAIERPDFLQSAYTENRTGDGSCRLVLRHWPIVDVTALSQSGNAIPAQGVVNSAPVDGWYVDTDADPERRFVLYLSGGLTFTDGVPVPVTYLAGYDATPDDVQQAVTEWVAFRYVRKASTGQTQARGVEGENSHFEEFAVPPNTLRVIAAYKRRFSAYGTDAADSSVGNDGGGTGQGARGGGTGGGGRGKA